MISSSRLRFASNSDEERPHLITILRPFSRSSTLSFRELFIKLCHAKSTSTTSSANPYIMSFLHPTYLFRRRSALIEERPLLTFSKSACVSFHHHLSCLEAIAQQSNQSRKSWNGNKSWSNTRSLGMLRRRAKQYGQARAIPAESPVNQCWKHRPHWMLRSIKSFAKFRLVLLLLGLDSPDCFCFYLGWFGCWFAFKGNCLLNCLQACT